MDTRATVMAAKKKPISKKKPASKPKAKRASSKPSAHKKSKAPASRGKAKSKSIRKPVLKKKKATAPRKKVAVAPPAASIPENAAARELAHAIAEVALGKKANDVMVIDVRNRGSAVGYDYIVLATGDSDRQLVAISESLNEAMKGKGVRASSVETSPDWVLVNYDDVVAHFFTPEKRATYDIEGLWSDAPSSRR